MATKNAAESKDSLFLFIFTNLCKFTILVALANDQMASTLVGILRLDALFVLRAQFFFLIFIFLCISEL